MSGQWSLTSGHVNLREVGVGKKWTKHWAPRRSGEAYSESEAKHMVDEFFKGDCEGDTFTRVLE